MTSKNPKPLTRPRKGELNHGKYCAQPGSLPTTDLPIQPSLKEQMAAANSSPIELEQKNSANSTPGSVTPQSIPFDYKACILCDHVIVQKILGNKCGESGALCCYMRSCPIEDRKKRESGPVCCQGSRRDSWSALWDC